MEHKAGFVNIIGNPNVGKSTLMNAMIGEKLSIITSKAQTTRKRIMGIVNGDDFQIVYSDTPGIIKPLYKLQEYMLGQAMSALADADIILYVTDVNETFDKNRLFLEKLSKVRVPLLVLLNKIDLSNEEKVSHLMQAWKTVFPVAEIIPISALENFNLGKVFDLILENLPDSPPYFPKDELTDKSERFFCSEMIREKILLNYQKEVPYSVEVLIDAFQDTDQLLRISGTIYVARESQKGIIIGHQGKALKRTGTMARKDLEDFFGKKVFLELMVKVKKEWRNDVRSLRNFGYHKS